MTKNLFFILSITILTFFFVSCTKPDIQFGQQILDNSNTQIMMVDTFVPKISTVYIDSFITSGKGVGVVGGYTDPAFGKIAAQTYYEIAPPPFIKDNTNPYYTNPYQYTIYDSVSLIIRLNKKNYYGDTTKPIHIDVNRLSQLIIPPNFGTSLYNKDTFSVNPTPLGSGDFMFYPSRTDTLAVRLDDNFGRALYAKLQNSNDIDVQNATNFLNYFNGIRLSGGSANNSLVIAASDSIILRLHFRRKGLFIYNDQTDFKVNNTSHHFSNITIDRTGSPINGINSYYREIPSEKTNNIAFLQAITGTMVKISFPSLYYVAQQLNFSKILGAKLIIHPILNTYPLYKLPPRLRLSVTYSAANPIGNDLSMAGSVGGSPASAQYGNLFIDYLNGLNTAYSYDLTEYIKNQLTLNAGFYPGNHYGLLLSPPSNDFETTFNRVLIGNDKNILGKIVLQVFYAAVK